MMKWILYNLKKLRIYLSLAILLSIGSTFLLIESSDALGDFTAAAGSVSDLHVLGRSFLSALLVYSIYICFDRFVYHPLLTRIQTYTYSVLEKKVYGVSKMCGGANCGGVTMGDPVFRLWGS